MDSPRCNEADTKWYIRMPSNPPLVNPRDETLLQLCEEENAILELTFLTKDKWLPH